MEGKGIKNSKGKHLIQKIYPSKGLKKRVSVISQPKISLHVLSYIN